MSQLLRISSKDRDKDQSLSSSSFKISFNNASNLQSIKRIVVKTVTIPNSFYNINEFNRTFTYKTDEITFVSVTIPSGQYNIEDFITAFNLSLAGIGMTASLNTVTGKLQYVNTTTIRYLNQEDGNAMADVLGIKTSATENVSSYSSEHLPNLSGTSEVYVVSNVLSDNSNMINKSLLSLPVLVCVPITSSFGSLTHYYANDSLLEEVVYYSQRLGKNIQSVDIKLIDRNGNLLDLQGLEFEMILRVYF